MKPRNIITPEQLEKVVEAIIAGKYIWACVLFLRFSGYNPLNYIPGGIYRNLIEEGQNNS